MADFQSVIRGQTDWKSAIRQNNVGHCPNETGVSPRGLRRSLFRVLLKTMNMAGKSFRSDNGVTRRLEHATCFRMPRHRVKGEAQRREGFLSVPICGIGTPQLRAPNYYETGNLADVWSRILSQLSSDLVSEEVRLSSYSKALSPMPCCSG